MKITASAVSLNVDDVAASAAFARDHLGFTEDMSADGFVSLSRADAGFNLIYLRPDLPTLKPERLRQRRADGLIIVFVVDDVDAEFARLSAKGAPIATAIETERGASDSSRSVIRVVFFQFVQWVTA